MGCCQNLLAATLLPLTISYLLIRKQGTCSISRLSISPFGFVTSLPGRAGLPIGSIDNVPLGLGLDDYRLGINPVKVLKFAFDEATNPVNYVTGPGVRQVLAAGAATTGARRGTQQWVRRVTADGAEEFVLEGTGRTGGSLARARASRQETAQTWRSNYNNLPAPLKAEMPAHCGGGGG